MMNLHDKSSFMSESTLTERGQVSIPAALRKAMHLRTGQRLRFEQISDREMRVIVDADAVEGPMSVLGYARRIRHGAPRRTADWMKELRGGEE
jgi:AbrB family looped-hinge helix DNA binding protein